ncbi:ComEC/Rec2 family competence protein [Timonella sp. A28]|uniref:ComEC/Rec2 family competence protein n=1 Tax=Timonella sp. A28 TaxID=3442640 RepID=UPI003EBC8082
MTYDLRLIPCAIAVWAATLWATQTTSRLVITATAVTAITTTLLFLTAAIVRRRTQRDTHVHATAWTITATLLMVILTLGTTAWHLTIREQSPLTQATHGQRFTTITGKISSEPTPIKQAYGEEKLTAILTTHTITTSQQHAQTQQKIRVFASQHHLKNVQYGDIVRIQGRAQAALSLSNEAATLQLSQQAEILTQHSGITAINNKLRTGLTNLVTPLPEHAQGLIPGIAIGDTSKLPENLEQAMRDTSLTHVTAVSGAHFTLIVLLISTLTWKLHPTLRASIVSLIAYALITLVHPSPSVLRAAAMCAVMLIAMTQRRRHHALPALCTAVIALLLWDPWNSRNFGFALSVLATAGLACCASPLARLLHRPWGLTFMPKTLAYGLAVPLAAQLAVNPVLIFLNPFIPTYAALANFAVAPALLPATLAGLGATLIAPLWHHGALALAYVASAATWWIAQCALFFSQLPWSTIPWPATPLGVALLLVFNGIVVVVLVMHHPYRFMHTRQLVWKERMRHIVHKIVSQQRIRAIHYAAAAMCIILVTASVVFVQRTHTLNTQSQYGNQWIVAACDVGQGDAFVVRTSHGYDLIDTGSHDSGSVKCLHQLGVQKLETIFISHAHEDHMGNLENILKDIPVDRVVTGPDIESSAGAHKIRTLTTHFQVPLIAGDSEKVNFNSSTTDWKAVWPSPEYVQQLHDRAHQGDEVTNDASLIIAYSFMVEGYEEPVDILFLGDLEQHGQQALTHHIRTTAMTGFDIVKVAHHGSASLSSDLIRGLSPTLALIGVGKNNPYGHPTTTALDMYTQSGSAILRTDECGTYAVGIKAGEWFVVGACP